MRRLKASASRNCQSPLIGLANPLAPPLTIGRKDDRHAHATGIFGSAYEGPPGSVHGGFVAAAFDEVLGYVQSLSGFPGMTGTLKVIYRSPTPLHTSLLFEAKLERVEGRKIFASARLEAGGVLCAEAEAIFISFREGQMKQLADARVERETRLRARDQPVPARISRNTFDESFGSRGSNRLFSRSWLASSSRRSRSASSIEGSAPRGSRPPGGTDRQDQDLGHHVQASIAQDRSG